MVPYFNARQMENAQARLEKIFAGAEATELTLPEALKTEVEAAHQAITDCINENNLVQSADVQERLDLLQTQDSVMLFLQRVRRVVGAHLSHEKHLAIRAHYGLARLERHGQERLMFLLANLKPVSDELEDEALKLSADVLTTAETLYQAIQSGLKQRLDYKAQKISLRGERAALLAQYRHLRTQVYAFLMESMPEGSRDPRLINFGFRPSNLRRNPAATETVTVVMDEETPAAISVLEPAE